MVLPPPLAGAQRRSRGVLLTGPPLPADDPYRILGVHHVVAAHLPRLGDGNLEHIDAGEAQSPEAPYRLGQRLQGDSIDHHPRGGVLFEYNAQDRLHISGGPPQKHPVRCRQSV